MDIHLKKKLSASQHSAITVQILFGDLQIKEVFAKCVDL